MAPSSLQAGEVQTRNTLGEEAAEGLSFGDVARRSVVVSPFVRSGLEVMNPSIFSFCVTKRCDE